MPGSSPGPSCFGSAARSSATRSSRSGRRTFLTSSGRAERTPGTLATLRTGQEAMLPTSMVVREDSLTLFGFLDDDEKQCFELLQTASGVGPKLAQAMLAVLAPDDLRAAVTHEDVKTLTQVPGIGQ